MSEVIRSGLRKEYKLHQLAGKRFIKREFGSIDPNEQPNEEQESQ